MTINPFDHNAECLLCDELGEHAPDCPYTSRYRYCEPGNDGQPATFTLTGAEILAEYFDHWSGDMRRAGKADAISYSHCIEDWIVVHWAERLP